MSTVQDLQKQVDDLTAQRDNLKKQLETMHTQMTTITAQCRATKQLCDELTNSNVSLRTNLLLQQEHSARREKVIKTLEDAQVSQPPVKDNKAA